MVWWFGEVGLVKLGWWFGEVVGGLVKLVWWFGGSPPLDQEG